mgnify:CR=1 FL=1
MGMGGGGGGGGSPEVQPQNNVQSSQSFFLPEIRGMLARASALSQQPLQQYGGQRTAPLNPTHLAALDAGRQMAFADNGPLKGAMAQMQNFSNGSYNQPAYVHPYLGPPVEQFNSPVPWGMGNGGGGVGGAPSPTQAPAQAPWTGGVPGPAPAPVAAPVAAPAPVSALPAGFDPTAFAAPVAAPVAAPAPNSMWGRGDPAAYAEGNPNVDVNDLVSQREWNNYLGLPTGGVGQTAPRANGLRNNYDRNDLPSKYELGLMQFNDDLYWEGPEN